jgi:hypothetical protein
MMRRSLLASMALAALTVVLAVHAQEPTKGGKGSTVPQATDDKGKPSIDTKTLMAKEKELAEKFGAFEKAILVLQQRLANSADAKDQARAKQLEKVLGTINGQAVGQKFTQLVKFLSEQKLGNTGEINTVVQQATSLAKDLKEILDLLKSDNGAGSKKDERIALENFVKELERVIRDQKIVRQQIDANPDKNAVKENQQDVTNNTGDLSKKLGPNGKIGEGGEAKDMKGAAKEGGKGTKADSKNDGKEGEGSKPGDSKDGGKGEGKKGDTKPGENKSGQTEPKAGSKEGKGAEGAKAGGTKDGKGDSKDAGQGKEGKGAEGGQAGQGKEPGKKEGQPDKQGNTAKGSDKAADKQPAVSKNAQGAEAAKAGDSKSGEASKAEPSASKSGGQGSGKSQGQSKAGSESKGQGQSKSEGQPSRDQIVGGSKSDNQPAPKSGNNNPKDDIANAKKRIQDAQEHQKQVEEEIAKGKRPEAGKEADEAIDNLEKAKKRLEDLIRQLREEELERILTALINRCQKMLAMQEEVLRGTLRVQGQIEASPSKKADRDHVLASLNLSDDELKIVHEATKAIEMLETEGSAVAFPEVFQQVREDMKHVQRRLKGTDVGDVTVTIEQDIIDTLKEMIKALEKAKRDLEMKKDPPKPNDSPPPPPQDQKLLDKIAELKMLKAMQLRVNARTELYSRRYAGEQAAEPGIREELRELAGRQDRIVEVANKMAKGDN